MESFKRKYVPSLRKSHPEDKDELEGVVEGEPVDGVDSRLNHSEEGVDHPVLSEFVSALFVYFLCSFFPHTVSHWLSSAFVLENRAPRE